MITEVQTKQDLQRFIQFQHQLYRFYPLMVYPFKKSIFKELSQILFGGQNAKAILSLDSDGSVCGRLFYSIQKSKNKKDPIGYWSFFETINDFEVVKELFDYMSDEMRKQGVHYIEGSFNPFDPDNRRGILVKGFDLAPTIFTSYNLPYYPELLEQYGFSKAYDTFSMAAYENEKTPKLMDTIQSYFDRHFDVEVDCINLRNLQKDMQDVKTIIEQASTDINYQEPPSMEMIQEVAKNMRPFINPNLILIAREKSDLSPIGFVLVLPDFNQLFIRTKGVLKPLYFLFNKRKITKARGVMQYVVPKYQSTGLIGLMYKKIYEEFHRIGITDFEAGTILEENEKSLSVFNKFDKKIIKIYRLYGKEISS